MHNHIDTRTHRSLWRPGVRLAIVGAIAGLIVGSVSPSWAGGELQGGELQGGELQGGELQGGELQGGELQGGELQGGELQGGELQGGGFRGFVASIPSSPASDASRTVPVYMIVIVPGHQVEISEPVIRAIDAHANPSDRDVEPRLPLVPPIALPHRE